MLLNEYQWSRNPRGMHNKNAPIKMDVDILSASGMGWAKYTAISDEYVTDMRILRERNITPIVRLWRPRFGAGEPEEKQRYYEAYIQAGCQWFELYNEPNLDVEWPEGVLPDYKNIEGIVAPLMTNWLRWAEWIVERGCYPAFPALSEAIGRHYDAIGWLRAMLTFLGDKYYERFRAVAANGLWCATHPYIYNHFYQEDGSPTRARPPERQRADEGGWHFEYPYDPISQADKPGVTTISGPPSAPNGDPIGLIGMGDAFMRLFREWFGGGAIPVVGTEGGIYPVPKSAAEFHQLDKRYPGYNAFSHGEATVAMFNWIATQAPPWFFGVALWKWDDYYETPYGPSSAVIRMSQTPPLFKDVPPLEALEGEGAAGIPRGWVGPGPIHGTPDVHCVLIGTGFNAEWFFMAGKAYYERFRPQLLPSPDFLDSLTYRQSAGITLLTLPSLAESLRAQLSARYPAAWLDVVAVETPEQLATVLNERAMRGLRFG